MPGVQKAEVSKGVRLTDIISAQVGPEKGVLVMSEFAGAAQALGAGCIRVNPYDIHDVARGIYEACL